MIEGIVTIFIFIIFFANFIFSKELDQKQIATFFVCPNTSCKVKHQPKSFIDSKDENVSRLLMTCTSCSQRGYFEKKEFHQLKCETCHNNIVSLTKWYSLNHKGHRDSSNKILNPCPNCNTYGAETYVPELPEKERGIQYSSKKNGKTIFILIIIALIVFFLTLVN